MHRASCTEVMWTNMIQTKWICSLDRAKVFEGVETWTTTTSTPRTTENEFGGFNGRGYLCLDSDCCIFSSLHCRMCHFYSLFSGSILSIYAHDASDVPFWSLLQWNNRVISVQYRGDVQFYFLSIVVKRSVYTSNWLRCVNINLLEGISIVFCCWRCVCGFSVQIKKMLNVIAELRRNSSSSFSLFVFSLLRRVVAFVSSQGSHGCRWNRCRSPDGENILNRRVDDYEKFNLPLHESLALSLPHTHTQSARYTGTRARPIVRIFLFLFTEFETIVICMEIGVTDKLLITVR